MSILIDKNTRIMIQGITGKQGRIHCALMQEYGANIVCGVTPGKGGQTVGGVPVFNTVSEALGHTQIDAALVLVPPLSVKDCVVETVEHGVGVIAVIADGVPSQDTMYMRKLAEKHGAIISGPNTTGIISPGKTKLGIMPGMLYSEGQVGIISRRGSLTHEVASMLSVNGIGQSTCFGIGGDTISGTTYVQILEEFRVDEQTKLVVLIGEIGGSGEESAARYLRDSRYPKPVVSLIVGRSAPEGKNMGHAGAIISGSGPGSAESKRSALREGGAIVVDTFEEMLEVIRSKL